jgi:hypothetical protein
MLVGEEMHDVQVVIGDQGDVSAVIGGVFVGGRTHWLVKGRRWKSGGGKAEVEKRRGKAEGKSGGGKSGGERAPVKVRK